MHVLAGIVTYNRANLIEGAIQALLAQTRRPDEIIIIDNNGSDNTGEVVKRYLGSGVRYIRTTHNLGGAGGFSLLMEIFLAGSREYLLLCDDDGTADPVMLEELLKNSSDLGIANALVPSKEDESLLAFAYGTNWPLVSLNSPIATIDDFKARAVNNIVYDIVCPFNGTLIKREVIEKVGTINPRMFIWGDEMDFIIRAKKANIAIGTPISAVVRHPKTSGSFTKQTILGKTFMPVASRAHISFRNAGVIDRAQGKKIRGFLWACKSALIYWLAGEYAMAIKQLVYYTDGYWGFFLLAPSGSKLVAAFQREKEKLVSHSYTIV